jgi:hypothetical protein
MEILGMRCINCNIVNCESEEEIEKYARLTLDERENKEIYSNKKA